MNITKSFVASLLLLCLAQEALADKTYILATGRRDPRMYAIDLRRRCGRKTTTRRTPSSAAPR